MANLLIDTISYGPNGELNASISGGIGPYYYSLNNAAQQPVQSFTYGGTDFNYINLSGLVYGKYRLIFTDSSNPAQTVLRDFTISAMQIAPACLYTGAGNLQGNVHVDYDSATIDSIQLTGPNGYSQNSKNLSAQFQNLAVFVFLANGKYKADALNAAGAIVQSEELDISCGDSEPLKIITVNATNASSKTNADGGAVAAIKYGVQYRPGIVVQTSLDGLVWTNATETAPSRYRAEYSGLKQGPYKMRARVLDTQLNLATGETDEYNFSVSYTKIFGCTNPIATNYNPNATDDDGSCDLPALVAKSHFLVPRLNSLRFVDMIAAATQLPTLDNRLYCAEKWQGISRPPYYQKITRDDVITTQFQSNYTTHKATLIDYQTGLAVKTFPVDNKRQNIGVKNLYPAFLVAHTADATKSRLYFNSGALPLSFVAGDRLEVLNATPASLNREYTIAGVGFDATQSVPFVIVNLPYPSVAPIPARINISAQTQYDLLPYNIYEFSTDWGQIPNGGYYIKIEASSTGFDDVLYNSEPISLYPEHEGTSLINWRNFDDSDDLTFATGLICGLRIESEFWQRFGGGTRKTYRGPDSKLIKLSATPQRKVKLNTFRLPPWLHEKLAKVFDFDYFSVNGEEYQSEDGYAEPAYVSRYALSNASITIEKVESGDTNSDDIGDINGVAPFIVIDEQFLQI